MSGIMDMCIEHMFAVLYCTVCSTVLNSCLPKGCDQFLVLVFTCMCVLFSFSSR